MKHRSPKVTHLLDELVVVISDLENEAQAAAAEGHASWFGLETVLRSLHTSAILLSDFGEQLAVASSVRPPESTKPAYVDQEQLEDPV